MYQMSRCYGTGIGERGGGLEYLTRVSSARGASQSEGVAYAATSALPRFYAFGPMLASVAASEYASSSCLFRTAHISPATVSYHSSLVYDLFHPHQEYHFSPDIFLKPGKQGIFVGDAAVIREQIEEVFEALLHRPFPSDVKINVCEEKQFRKIAPHPGTVGVSFNRSKHGLLSEIFVLEGSLARVLLTIGHEIGHVLTPTLADAKAEEAKAYAFSLAWLEIIQARNIGGLGNAFISENPAQNGLHNVAFVFVSRLLAAGKNAWEIYLGLLRGELAQSSG